MLTQTNRIQKNLETLASYTSTPGHGVTRSSYSKEDTLAKEYLIKEMKKLHLDVYEDGIGTIFGRREGTLTDAPVVMFGSHYDSVVNGGALTALPVLSLHWKSCGFLQRNSMKMITLWN